MIFQNEIIFSRVKFTPTERMFSLKELNGRDANKKMMELHPLKVHILTLKYIHVLSFSSGLSVECTVMFM